MVNSRVKLVSDEVIAVDSDGMGYRVSTAHLDWLESEEDIVGCFDKQGNQYRITSNLGRLSLKPVSRLTAIEVREALIKLVEPSDPSRAESLSTLELWSAVEQVLK